MKTHAFRLRRGDDLRVEIDRFVAEKAITAGVILTCVGNLEKAVLRMADASVVRDFEGSFEVVSLVGTVEAGNSHLHIAISDESGATFGGHLKEGSIVGFTVEVVMGVLDGMQFRREVDDETGYKELIVTEEKID